MTLYEILNRRRSCRKFTTEKVDSDTVNRILEGAFTAPSSKNSRSTRFAVVEDPATIEKLGDTRTRGSAFVKDAPLVIIVMAEAAEGILWVENCSISATIVQLLAEEEGLGSCWVQVRERLNRDDQPDGLSAEEYIQSVVPQTAGYHIECLIAIGRPAAAANPRKETDDNDKVVYVK